MLTRIDTGLWTVNHPFRLMRLFPLGHRMTVVELPDGGLVLHSPIPWAAELAAELSELGEVRYLLAPSMLHHLWLEPWCEEYPGARLLAVPGFAEHNPRLRVDAVLDGSTELPGLRCLPIDGMPKVNECAVLHRASRTLVVADLVFHFPRSNSLALRTLLRCVGAYGRVASSRLYRSLVRDRAALRASLDALLAQDFDRLIVGHGEIVETGAVQKLRNAWR